VPDYEKRFATADFAAPVYRRELSATVKDACRRYGLRYRSDDTSVTLDGRSKPVQPQHPAQIFLSIPLSA